MTETDTEIEFHETDERSVDVASNEVSLHTALRKFECPDCGDGLTWILDPDPDSLAYYSDNTCECNRQYTIKPTKVKITGYEVCDE